MWNALRRQQDAVSNRFAKKNKGFEGPIDMQDAEALLRDLNDGVSNPFNVMPAYCHSSGFRLNGATQ